MKLCSTNLKTLTFKLCLKKLKTLTFNISDTKIVLETPQLETIMIFRYSKLHVIYANSIRTFVCDYVPEDIDRFPFPNLRRLVIKQLRYNIKLDLEDFPQLKLVELYTTSYEEHVSVIKFARSLRKQQSVLKLSDLQIVVNGFRDVEVVYEMVGFGRFTAQIDFEAAWNDFDKMISDYKYATSFRFEDYHLLQRYCPNIEGRKKFMKKF